VIARAKSVGRAGADHIYLRPLFLCLVPAGTPAPADDEIDRRLDLNRHIFRNPESILMAWVRGDGFRSAGVFDGDLLVADSSQEARPGQLVVVKVGGEQRVMRLTERGGRLFLTADDGPCELVEVGAGREINILAVVTFTIHTVPD
jgi:DNA polymerase V